VPVGRKVLIALTKEEDMYGKAKVLGISNVATGLVLLPNINNKVLFIAAAALLTIGASIFVASLVLARKTEASK
jgi:uncharacterized membrane protein YkgB